MHKEFKVGETYPTRDGRDARVICIDAKGELPIIALIVNDRDSFDDEVYWYSNIGKYYFDDRESAHDLMHHTRTVYINFYKHNSACVYHGSPELAKEQASRLNPIATAIPVEIPME